MSSRLAAAVLGVASVATAQAPAKPPAGAQKPAAGDGKGDFVEMTVEDVIVVDRGATPVVLLKSREDGRLLPIWIGASEALAIQLRLARRKPPRPLTHDLIERMLSVTGAIVLKVHVEDLRDSTFLGRIYMKVGSRTVDLDARPSDSIAIALGARAPIFAARKVVDQAGIDAGALREGGPTPDLEDLLKKGRPPGKGQSI